MSSTTEPRTGISPRDEGIRRRYLEVDTSNVADVLDEMEHRHQGLFADFAPQPAEAGRLSGWACTILSAMAPRRTRKVLSSAIR